MRQKIYVISGLGADHTVFCRLNLPGFELVHVQWVDPVKHETLTEYAGRLLPQIKDDNPILLGLSLGGMIALEISQLISCKWVVSLSSVTGRSEFPFYYRLAGKLRLNKLMPIGSFSRGNAFNYWLFGAKKKEDKEILNRIFQNADRQFLVWALHALLNLDRQNANGIVNLTRIHGTADLILPIRKKSNYDFIIPKGTHLMVLDQHELVSQAILKGLGNNLGTG